MTTATVSNSSGVNVNYGSSNYIANFPAMFNTGVMNYGYFNNSFTNASQYGLAANYELGTLGYTGGDALLAAGNLTYNSSTHRLSGQLDSLAFGDELNGVTPGVGTTSTAMSLGSTDFSLTGLNLNSANGDDVHGILYGMMTGDETGLINYLATHAVTFNGGGGADSYQGGTQADILNGGNGADILAGGGGADTLNGGNGSDHFVFASVSNSTTTSFDTISQFAAGGASSSIDIIDVSGLGLSGFSGSTATANSIWYSAGKFFADTTGDTTADFAVAVTSLTGTLNASDFLL